MLLAEKIKRTVEQAIPIYYEATAEHKKHCRIEIARREMLRTMRSGQIWEEVAKIIEEKKKEDSSVINQFVNDYFDHYFENQHDH